MSSPIRRVGSGKDTAGKAIAIIDSAATALHRREELGATNTLLWVLDSIPAKFPDPASLPIQNHGIVPTSVDANFLVIDFAPEGKSRTSPRDPAIPRTKIVDYAMILSGEIDMLVDGSEIHLKQGDVVMQRGATHAWVNRGDQPCQVAFILVDAKD